MGLFSHVGEKCTSGLKISVLRSGAGFYIGTMDEEGPRCRLSRNYGKTREDKAMDIDRVCDENMFCNGGCGCFSKCSK